MGWVLKYSRLSPEHWARKFPGMHFGGSERTPLLDRGIGRALRSALKSLGLWESIKELARAYEYIMALILFMPIAILSWFPFVSEFQTRLLFNQAFSRGLQISMILAGRKEKDITSPVKYA
ncbi:callose synthase 7-like [Durio zibethinus]|uniref:Callose synthase 7-like n=1 Tax=Durio zibethinus TaxID=66656 RepID=A0A6P5Y159_DURZI|nr:callose synthase 7-like [Durio zibethinus]XP_022734164.1 callose synthase 7-like [Durio zibethinus]